MNKLLQASTCLCLTILLSACRSSSDDNGNTPSDPPTFEQIIIQNTSVVFPPRQSLTTSETITVRGTSADVDVSSIKVNDIEATTSDNFATWQATVDLAMGENTFSISVSNGEEKVSLDDWILKVTRDTPLPDSFEDVAIDMANNRLLGLDDKFMQIIAYDLTNHSYSVLADNQNDDALSQAGYEVYDLDVAEVNPTTKELIVIGSAEVDKETKYDDTIMAVNLDTGERRIIAAHSNFMAPKGIVIDDARQLAYVSDWHNERIISVNLDDGSYTTLTNYAALGIPKHNRFYHLAWYGDELLWGTKSDDDIAAYAINLNTLTARTLYNSSSDGIDIITSGIEDIAIDTTNDNLILTTYRSVHTYDLTSGEFSTLLAEAAPSSPRTDYASGKLIGNTLYLYDQDTFEFSSLEVDRAQLTTHPLSRIGTSPGNTLNALYLSSDQTTLYAHDSSQEIIRAYDTASGEVTSNLDITNAAGGDDFSQTGVYDPDTNSAFYVRYPESQFGYMRIDLNTGLSTLLGSADQSLLTNNGDIDIASETAYVLDRTGSHPTYNAELYSVDINTGAKELISTTADLPEFNYEWIDDLKFDSGNHTIYIADDNQLIAVDAETGEHSVLSDDSSSSDEGIRQVEDILIDGDRLLVADTSVEVVYAVDRTTGERTVITGNSKGKGPLFDSANGIALADNDIFYIAESNLDAIIVVDETNGDRVIWQR
ncbi:PQQ-binding-like beta-propeller repeat protein [Endozoicomonas atrinae]|uniref:outer membrane protein assembly factor BamB family protein n=2 Tax=Endozoicomonas atrinae TaxID=1333660 RepID=UPI0008250BFA|nr:PQQ-binding-like beta-propeller repeat protein [Endozoicomonas atrinae]